MVAAAWPRLTVVHAGNPTAHETRQPMPRLLAPVDDWLRMWHRYVCSKAVPHEDELYAEAATTSAHTTAASTAQATPRAKDTCGGKAASHGYNDWWL